MQSIPGTLLTLIHILAILSVDATAFLMFMDGTPVLDKKVWISFSCDFSSVG